MAENKSNVVVITGAAGNLGAAVTQVFRKAAANLVLIDRSPDRLQRMYPELADSVDHFLAHSVDLTDEASVTAAINETLQRFGRIDALINTAGGYKAGTPLHETPLSDWDFMLNLNARSVLISCRAVAKQMLQQGSGRIVNVASRSALHGEALAGAYCASKSVVVRLTETLAAELKDAGINVNCVLPSLIDTPPNRQAMPDADYSRWVAPEAIADVIFFLASAQSRAINGAAIPVYGRS